MTSRLGTCCENDFLDGSFHTQRIAGMTTTKGTTFAITIYNPILIMFRYRLVRVGNRAP